MTSQAVRLDGAPREDLARKFSAVRDAWRESLRARDLDAVAELAARFARWGNDYEDPNLAHWAQQTMACVERFDLDGLDRCAAEIDAATANLSAPVAPAETPP
ncbi:MAG: hypothetical protein FJ100_08895 [Deltaproteobacteria bacterium]|nr:hypothetical protein [Deltaproteobacteria bacterium]